MNIQFHSFRSAALEAHEWLELTAWPLCPKGYSLQFALNGELGGPGGRYGGSGDEKQSPALLEIEPQYLDFAARSPLFIELPVLNNVENPTSASFAVLTHSTLFKHSQDLSSSRCIWEGILKK
jgi:hypothetical protein